MLNFIPQFSDAIQAAGMIPPNAIEADGELYRFSSNGKKGDDAGWYVLHGDGIPAGKFGNWRTSFAQNWRADIGRTLTPAEEAESRAKIAAAQAKREAEEIKRKANAKAKALSIWEKAEPAPGDHPYLARKGIKANGAKLHSDGRLVIPMRADGEIHSLQFIGSDGVKRFLTDGRVKGCYFSMGNPNGAAALCIAEGFATGATIFEATGFPMAIAFNAGNLGPVSKAMRDKFPDLPLILCADDDIHTEGNPGLTKATEAARSIGGLLAIPDFGCNRPDGMTDFNDMAQLSGAEAVRLAVANALPAASNCANPEPLPALPAVLPFDYDYLPGGLRPFVRDISERMQCPPDFAAVAVFVMMATIIGRKVGIRPMRHNDWLVICNLWGAVVGNSGVMKSPTLSATLTPVKRLQQWAFEEFNNKIGDHVAQEELAKLQKAVAKSEAKKKLGKDQSADVAGLLKPVAGEDAPILKRYITNNASYEALGELLMENPNGLMVESDEIIGLLKQLDASGQEVARSFYLTAADGDKSYTFDRIMRGKGLHIPALCLSIIGGIQPGVLAEYVRQATGGGAGADGLLQRFGLMVYPDISPNWKEVDRYPDKMARESVNELAERMDNLRPEAIGAEIDQFEAVPFLRFDDAAQSLFSEWRADLETRLRSGEEHPSIVSHLSKYRKLIPSLALINHLCDDGIGPVNETALLRAIAFSEYLESHARRIYSYATRPDIDAAKTLLKKLSTGKLATPFKVRDIYRAGWTGLETPQKAQSAISLLLEYKHLTEEELSTGGRSTSQFHWIREVAP
jgi:putative DNA primase/helicase